MKSHLPCRHSYSGPCYVWKCVTHCHQDHFKSASYVTNSITKAKCHIENQFCVRGTVLAEPQTLNPLGHNPQGLCCPAAVGLLFVN